MPDIDPATYKIICANTHGINVPDDPSFPYKLEATFQHGEFMRIAAIALYGGCERVVIRGATPEVLRAIAESNEWPTHPRLIQLTIVGPDGKVVPQPPAPESVAPSA